MEPRIQYAKTEDGVSIDPAEPDQVAQALLEYLVDHLGATGLRFAEPPQEITVGWETYIYGFRLAGESLDPAWEEPLILRALPDAALTDPAEKAGREAAIQAFVTDQGYPAPRPLAVETGENALGRPFIVMERVPGVPMFERMNQNVRGVLGFISMFADMQVALHRLPVAGSPLSSDGPLVDRQLAELRRMIEEFAVEQVDEPLAWLEAHKRTVMPEEVSLCHNDFHPLNIMMDDDDSLRLLDWGAAQLGDRHCDVANTVVLMRTAPVEPRGPLDRLIGGLARRFFAWRYLVVYRRQLPLDEKRLCYWEALHAFQWWVGVIAIQSPRSADVGVKRDTAQRIPAGHLERMKRYFWNRARALQP